MNHALFLNTLICLLVGGIAWLTNSPLAILGLLLLKDLPYGLVQFEQQEQEPMDEGRPIGFLADVEKGR